MPNYQPPEIPLILTRRDWDKKKGVFAKAAGKTGVGEQCDKLAAAYRAVKWERIDLTERRRVVLKNLQDSSFTKANWDKVSNEARAEVLGPIAKVNAEAYKLRDLCLKTEGKFRDSNTIPKSSTEHVKKMAAAADTFGISVNKNSLGAVLKRMTDEFNFFINEALIGDSKRACVSLGQKYANLPDRWRADPSPSNVNGNVRTDVRRFTQLFGNMARIGERGFGPKVAEASRLFDELTPYADPTTVIPTSASNQDSLATLAVFEPIFRRSLTLVRSNPLG